MQSFIHDISVYGFKKFLSSTFDQIQGPVIFLPGALKIFLSFSKRDNTLRKLKLSDPVSFGPLGCSDVLNI